MAFQGLVITNQGRELVARATQSGTQITFTKIVYGDSATDRDFATLTWVLHEQLNFPVVGVERQDDQILIEGQFSNHNMVFGFYLREIGLIASDGTDEILFAYDNAGDDAEFINAPETPIDVEHKLRLILAISSDANIQLSQSSTLYMTQADFEEALAPVNAHIADTVSHVTAANKQQWTRKARVINGGVNSLPVDQWFGDQPPYEGEASISSAFKQGERLFITPVYSGTIAEIREQRKQWGYIYDVECCDDGYALFTAYDKKPTVALQFEVAVIRNSD